MLPRENHLRKENDFKEIFRVGSRARSGPFQLLCRKNNDAKTRFGFVVPLSVSKKAVRRNKLRRRLSEIVRRVFLNDAVGYDCVIRAYAGADMLPYDTIEKHIMDAGKKIHLAQKI